MTSILQEKKREKHTSIRKIINTGYFWGKGLLIIFYSRLFCTIRFSTMSILEKSGTKIFNLHMRFLIPLLRQYKSPCSTFFIVITVLYSLLSFLLLKISAFLFIILVKHHSSSWCQWAIYVSRGIPMRYKEYKSSPNQFNNRKTNYIFSNTSNKSHIICKTICKMKSLDSVILKISH